MAPLFLALAAICPMACRDDPLTFAEVTLPGPVYLHAETGEVDFGETLLVGGDQIHITIANPDSSQGALTFEATVGGGPYSLVDASGSLEPGGETEITVRFKPEAVGTFTDEIVIGHNGSNLRNPLRITLTGRGTRTRVFEGNPLFWAADPAGHVWFDGKMWIYTTMDVEDWDEMLHWNAWSSPDLRTWTLHEGVFGAADCDWCVNNAWAPDIAYRSGRYYLYYYFSNDGTSPGGIGVAVSDRPEGPFQNLSVGGPLVDGHDPAVFVDDDGQTFLYAGHMIYFLNPDMVSLQEVGGRTRDHPLQLMGHDPVGGWESLWVFKRENTYYLSLADEDYRQLRYYMGSSPLGPFSYAGTLLEKAKGINIHHSIVPFGDRWVLWYHLWDEEGPGHRRISGEYLTFREDGTIQPVAVSEGGVAEDSVLQPGSPHLVLGSTELDFGETLIIGGKDAELEIQNLDSAPSSLRYEAALEDGPFEVVRGRGALAPGASGKIRVRFSPETEGPAEASLALYHNAANEPSPLLIRLRGQGSTSETFEGNPLFWAADPAGHVWKDGQMWIYPTSDNEDWNQLREWNAWSSPDLRRWTVHRNIFSSDDCNWCVSNAWAPDVAYRDGRYFLYYYFRNEDGHAGGIGVAVGEDPQGPFTNLSVDGPLVDGHDPAVFVDDDGQAYLYVGRTAYLLNPDMASLERVGSGLKSYSVMLFGHVPVGGWESAWVFKREGRYYFSLADEDYRQLRYYVGSSPLGPFSYAGTLLEKTQGLNIHHSIVPFGDRWVLWYHLWDEEGAGQRRIRGEFLTFNEDGTIQPVSVSEDGVGR